MRRVTCYTFRKRRDGRIDRTFRARVGLPGGRVEEFSTGSTDKRVADQIARKRLREMECERYGLVPPRAVRESADAPLPSLIVSYLGDLTARGRAKMYVYTRGRHLRRLVAECGWHRFADLTPGTFTAWRASHSAAAKTLNEYRDAVAGFCRWMVATGKALGNPMQTVGKVETRGTERRVRRALGVVEQQRLLSASPPERRFAYLLALTTGLRRAELRSVRVGDVAWGGSPVMMTVAASATKNRRVAAFVVRDDVAAMARGLGLADLPHAQRLIRVPPVSELRADLRAAGVPEVDHAGRRVDFHALRHTAITNGGRAGISPRVLQQYARHSDSRLTERVYSDPSQLPTAGVVERLPRYDGVMEGVSAEPRPLERPLERDAGGRFASCGVASGHARQASKTLDSSAENRKESHRVAASRGETENSLSTTQKSRTDSDFHSLAGNGS